MKALAQVSDDRLDLLVGACQGSETLSTALEPQRALGADRAREIELLEHTDRVPVGGYKGTNVVGIDGKVFSSPVRTLDRERTDRRTGEVRSVREDLARERYGQGGVDNIVWGTKFAIASVRSPKADQRVIRGSNTSDQARQTTKAKSSLR